MIVLLQLEQAQFESFKRVLKLRRIWNLAKMAKTDGDHLTAL